jgi:hypothetical protein
MKNSPRQDMRKSPTNKDVEGSLKKEESRIWVEGGQLELSLKQLNDNSSLKDLAEILKINTSIIQINVLPGNSTTLILLSKSLT